MKTDGRYLNPIFQVVTDVILILLMVYEVKKKVNFNPV